MDSGAYEWFFSNVGVADISGSDGYEWYYSNVNPNQPDPFVLGCTPIKARTGDSAEAIARGVGETANQYIPTLQGQSDDGTWVTIPYTSFTYVPPSSDAYNDYRTISSSYSVVDVAHTKLGFIVPSWATPPNLPIRVTTSETGVVWAINRSADETFYSNVTT